MLRGNWTRVNYFPIYGNFSFVNNAPLRQFESCSIHGINKSIYGVVIASRLVIVCLYRVVQLSQNYCENGETGPFPWGDWIPSAKKMLNKKNSKILLCRKV